jgi:hypothetical protein
MKSWFVLAFLVALVGAGLMMGEWRSPTYKYQGAVDLTAAEALLWGGWGLRCSLRLQVVPSKGIWAGGQAG